jgi:SSS family transporter
MHPIDWAIVVVYLVWLIYDGLKRTKERDSVEGYFLANRRLPWWAVGLSVMATQLSAITLVGTTGQAYEDGMRFIQFYFGLPLAMILLSVTAVPFFYHAKVYTAYEYLERRFDARTRTAAALLFLLSRAASCGVIISAPAVILSVVFGWNLSLTVLAMGLPTIFYTMFGGVQAVAWTDVKQMVVIIAGVLAAAATLVLGLPSEVGLLDGLKLAGATGRLQAVDFRLSLAETYTFWSGLIGGLFLALSYFGCDQSQVQRYLTARSANEGRRSLLMSAYFKIPLQALILLAGVLVFVYYVFERPPVVFNQVHVGRMAASPQMADFRSAEQAFGAAHESRRQAALEYARARSAGDAATELRARGLFLEADAEVRAARRRAAEAVRMAADDPAYRDVNYVFPTFITTRMPVGLVGLMIAAIFAAAMSSIAAELNALATSTVIDFYRRWYKPVADDRHYLFVSKLATGVWGVFACLVAVYAANLGSLIEVVNRIGSLFYGSLLGVFMLAFLARGATAAGAFWGLLAGLATVFIAASSTSIAFLWHNVIGAVVVVVIGSIVSRFAGPGGAAAAAGPVR